MNPEVGGILIEERRAPRMELALWQAAGMAMWKG